MNVDLTMAVRPMMFIAVYHNSSCLMTVAVVQPRSSTMVDQETAVSEAASHHSLPRYVSSECLPDWRTYSAYDFENLVMSGGGSKGYAYIGALKVTNTQGSCSIQRPLTFLSQGSHSHLGYFC